MKNLKINLYNFLFIFNIIFLYNNFYYNFFKFFNEIYFIILKNLDINLN